ncbi:hypothetical protein [Streptococcus equi]|uniref:hypothetical protein n=1 Tax=Streptococcus equi TaxID=1336 RepID=UPI001BB4875F|nr:hypothetical protein [Streptococcus equi]HEM6084517.1 hypothetical protein [Streptococcus suis]MCD3380262.1 hypothetical protein [Streptococcus equi subsp. zooepidemicus]MCD3385113.1 hypothetical protein [Streptococcus equi subsp. zooepidemicus]MCD3390093.1 hypothetical protein [Streptococcus equi subsp. zooepidemicus]MCD3393532.1 hypothetical protein [Streptococcus equi subsp. zooepidemicus]
MARGKPIPAEHQFAKPVKFSAVIDETTRLNIEIVAGQLVPEFGYAPSQGQVIDYVFKKYLNK